MVGIELYSVIWLTMVGVPSGRCRKLWLSLSLPSGPGLVATKVLIISYLVVILGQSTSMLHAQSGTSKAEEDSKGSRHRLQTYRSRSQFLFMWWRMFGTPPNTRFDTSLSEPHIINVCTDLISPKMAQELSAADEKSGARSRSENIGDTGVGVEYTSVLCDVQLERVEKGDIEALDTC